MRTHGGYSLVYHKEQTFVEALHDGSRCGVWTREGECKMRVFINDSKHVCILRL